MVGVELLKLTLKAHRNELEDHVVLRMNQQCSTTVKTYIPGFTVFHQRLLDYN